MKAFIFWLMALLSSFSWSESITLTAVGDPWPVLLNPEAENKGLIFELAREAFATQDYDLKIEFVPWSRAMSMIKQQRADLLIGAWYTAERNSYLLYSMPIFSSVLQFLKNKNSSFEYLGLDSLEGLRVGTISSYQYDQGFLQNNSIEKITSASLLNNINNLIIGRIDLTVDDHYVLKHTLDKHIDNWQSKLSLVANPLTDKQIFIAANRTNPQSQAIIKAFNLGLVQLKKEGRYKKIIQSYNLE